MNRAFFENIPLGTHLFGRFILLSVITASDHGAVYQCRCTWGEHRGKILALKVAHSGPSSQLLQQQLIKEIKILGKVRHPNIIQAFDWFQDEEFLAYSMEYVEGGTLDSVLELSPGRSVQWSVDLLMQLALGLREIHQTGIIHRDIKPQNILVTPQGQLKIADFGIAVRLQSRRTDDSDQITGTIDFVCPEYIRSGTYDQRSDIYAWGVIAYLMLTGHVPFEDESIVDALARKATEDPQSPRSHRVNIPEGLSALILKALARRPEHRFQSCDELIDALRTFEARPRPTVAVSRESRLVLIREVA